MANVITLIRIPLLFVFIFLLNTGRPVVIFWCIPFIIMIMLLDMVDGMVARALGKASLLGSVLDIAVDRALEIIVWVVFSCLGLIPLLIPLIVIIRGTLTDAVRCVGNRRGEAAFNQLKSPVSRFIVSSRFMRDFYGFIKGVAFSVLTLDYGCRISGAAWSEQIHWCAVFLAWLTIAITILRGIPVLFDEISSFDDAGSDHHGQAG